MGSREHVPAGGYTLRDGVNFEVYVRDHRTPPDQLRTDLSSRSPELLSSELPLVLSSL